MWVYLLQGIAYGLAAASQPGPFQTYLISQTLLRGWKKALPAALAPLVSDGPIILICITVLSQVPKWLERGLYIAGGLFILYLAYGAFNSWKNFVPQTTAQADFSARQNVLQAALTNALSPGPYLFWTLATGPILLKGWRETPLHGISFLAGFYITLLLSLSAIIIVFGATARFGPKVNRALLGISAVALFIFGLYQLWQGFFPS